MLFQKIKSALTIKQVVEFYGLKFTRGKAICPFHNEKTPSLVIYTKSQTFQCMGCKQGGDVITFVSKLFGLTNIEAIKRLDNDFKLGITEKPTKEELERFRQQQALREKQMADAKKKEEKYFRLWEVFVEYDKICINNKPDKFGASDLWLFANEMREIYWNMLLKLQ